MPLNAHQFTAVFFCSGFLLQQQHTRAQFPLRIWELMTKCSFLAVLPWPSPNEAVAWPKWGPHSCRAINALAKEHKDKKLSLFSLFWGHSADWRVFIAMRFTCYGEKTRLLLFFSIWWNRKVCTDTICV